MRIGIVGGGAAGIFSAIRAAEETNGTTVVVFEATDCPLDKVRISGGGRCNVTHHCFDPGKLVKSYPRGHRELRGPFSRFQPRDTIAWFSHRGVTLKVEDDGRVLPVTDNSQTIIDSLLGAASKAGVTIRLNSRVKTVERTADSAGSSHFVVTLHDGNLQEFDRILLATGSGPQGYRFAQSLGHTIVPCVPSLFTFKVTDPRLEKLAGISFQDVSLQLKFEDGETLAQRGPMLITHWGVSGPAVLKLSAWGARKLHDRCYRAKLLVDFAPDRATETLQNMLSDFKQTNGRKQVRTECPVPLPSRYWQQLTAVAGVAAGQRWANVLRDEMAVLVRELKQAEFSVTGKGVFKEEFVTCGGVSLKEVDFKTMVSRVCPGLFLAGELLDIDGVTGGFNFQSAWTTGWLAGGAMGSNRTQESDSALRTIARAMPRKTNQ